MFQWSNKRSSGSSANSGYPGSRTATTIQGSIRPPTITRKEHIDSYLLDTNLKKSTRKVSKDDTTFDTVFSTVSQVTLILRVHLPYGSDSYPAMSLAGATGTHAWLDHRMCITGYPPIKDQAAWVDSALRLGDAVKAVVEHLQVHPPTNIRITDPGLQGIQPAGGPAAKSSLSSSTSSNVAMQRQNQPPPPQYQEPKTPDVDLPPIPRHFKELDSMTLAELEVLQADELSFKAFCNRLETTGTLRKIASSVLEDNVTKAEKHLKHEEKAKRLEKEVAEMSAELKEAVREFQAMEKEQDKICAPPDFDGMHRELDDLKRQSFRESEELAETWTEEGGDVSTFLTEFIAARKVHHTQAAKLELITQQNPV